MISNENRQWRNNVRLVLGMSCMRVFLVIMPIVVPFFQSKGLDMQDVFLLQAAFMALVLVLEVPSGYVADVWGRRGALLAGCVASGVGHTVLLFADGFWDLFVFEAGMAVARSLISGADLAVAYESSRLAGDEAEGSAVGRLFAWQTVAEAVAAVLCSIVLVFGDMVHVVLLQVFAGWLPLMLVLRIVEPPREVLEASHHAENFRRVFTHLWQGGTVLRLTVLVWCVWGLTTYYAVWLLQTVWQNQQLALVHFGYLWGGYWLVAAAAGRWASGLERRLGAPALLVFCGAAPVLGYLGLACPDALTSVVGGMLFFAARGLGVVLLQQAFNARVPDAFRATANSLLGFGFSIAAAITGPLAGAMVDAWPLSHALAALAVFSALVCGCLVTPLVLAVRRAARRAPA